MSSSNIGAFPASIRASGISCRNRRVMQPAIMRLPAVRTETYRGAALFPYRCRSPGQPCMGAILVVISPEFNSLISKSATVQKSVRSRHSLRSVPIRSITTSAQWVRRIADSHRNRSTLHKLSFAWPSTSAMTVPPRLVSECTARPEYAAPDPCSSEYRRPTSSGARDADIPRWDSVVSCRQPRRSPPDWGPLGLASSALWTRTVDDISWWSARDGSAEPSRALRRSPHEPPGSGA